MGEMSDLPRDDGQSTIPRQQHLTSNQLEIVFYIERYHSSVGDAPTDEKILDEFNIEPAELTEFKQNSLVLKSMEARGIPYPHPSDKFTPSQMAAAATMLDPYDRRSDEKKLRDIGLTTRQWSSWLQDREFASYLRDRSELMFQNSMLEAHKGIIKGMRNGNVASITKYYEMTGRHDPNRENQVNVQLILHSLIEVIQRYVKDPVVMHNIATEMSSIAAQQNGNVYQMPRQIESVTIKGLGEDF